MLRAGLSRGGVLALMRGHASRELGRVGDADAVRTAALSRAQGSRALSPVMLCTTAVRLVIGSQVAALGARSPEHHPRHPPGPKPGR